MPTLTLTLPKRLAWQNQIVQEAKRFNVINIGRRAGKTTLGIDRCATVETLAYPVGWFSPSYKMLIEVWRNAERIFTPITNRKSVQDHRLEFVTGGVLEFWSLDDPNVARGRKYKRVIIDEAAMIPSLMDAWNYVLRPTLADYKGDAWFLSTPKGLNFFWQMWQWGQDPAMGEWASWKMPTTANPLIPLSEVEAMRATMPERVFAQEILADFVEDAAGVFRRVRDAATAEATDRGKPGDQYLFGVDFGKHEDFTVITVVDIKRKALVWMDRFNQIDYHVQIGRLQELYQRFKPVVIIAERNSMGDPLIEQLQRQGLPVWPFTTTHATKTEAIDALALAFERGEISILNDPVLIGELLAYTMERLPSGSFRYGAPDGSHDDCVMSLALAWWGASNTQRPRARSKEY
jgi:hypothetical protein